MFYSCNQHDKHFSDSSKEDLTFESNYQEIYDKDSNLLVTIAYLEGAPYKVVHYSLKGKIISIEIDSTLHFNQAQSNDPEIGRHMYTNYCSSCHQMNRRTVANSILDIYALDDELELFNAYTRTPIHDSLSYPIDSTELRSINAYLNKSINLY